MSDKPGDFDEQEEERPEGEYPPAVPAPKADPEQGPEETPPPAPESGEYVEPPTEELFAFEARVEEGEVPDLDPVFRAALLESSESAVAGEPADGADAGTAGEAPADEAPQPTEAGEDAGVTEE